MMLVHVYTVHLYMYISMWCVYYILLYMVQGPEKLTAEIKRWEERLEACWEGEPTDVLDLALVDTKVQ